MSGKPAKHIDHEDHGRPSQDNSGRHPRDATLRKAGYAIAARPNSGEPIWTKNGRRFTQSVALRRIQELGEDFQPANQGSEE